MELRPKGKSDRVEIIGDIGLGYVLLDVGHHLFGSIAPARGT